jgi:hypothetical protein
VLVFQPDRWIPEAIDSDLVFRKPALCMAGYTGQEKNDEDDLLFHCDDL